jgi:hypothetical protein
MWTPQRKVPGSHILAFRLDNRRLMVDGEPRSFAENSTKASQALTLRLDEQIVIDDSRSGLAK